MGKFSSVLKRLTRGAANFFTSGMAGELTPVAMRLVGKMMGSRSKKKFEAVVFVLQESGQLCETLKRALKDDTITAEEAQEIKAALNEFLKAKQLAEAVF